MKEELTKMVVLVKLKYPDVDQDRLKEVLKDVLSDALASGDSVAQVLATLDTKVNEIRN